jgi:hypothetical protein
MENLQKEELIEMFQLSLGYGEYDPQTLWEIICDNNDLDYDNEITGELFEQWYKEENIEELWDAQIEENWR